MQPQQHLQQSQQLQQQNQQQQHQQSLNQHVLQQPLRQQTNQNGGRQLNTVLNSRQAQYPDLRYSLTGLCERSVADHFNKIESTFLEKYMRYIVIDDFMPTFFKRNIGVGSETSSVFVSNKNFTISNFLDETRKSLRQFSNISANQLIIHCFGTNSAEVKENDLVSIQCCVKITNERLRRQPDISLDLLRRSLKNEVITSNNSDNNNPNKSSSSSVHHKESTRVHLIVFYNGDINFEFDKYPGVYSKEKQLILQENGQPLSVQLQMVYLSKVALFQHFVVRNNFLGETIDDRTITSYELIRATKRQREVARQQAEAALQNQRITAATASSTASTGVAKVESGQPNQIEKKQNNHKWINKLIRHLKNQSPKKRFASILLLSTTATISLYFVLRKLLVVTRKQESK